MASVVVTMDAREAALFRAQQKILDKQVELNKKLEEGGKTSEKAGRTSKDSFDKSTTAVGKLQAGVVSYVAGLATVTTAVMAVKAAWELVRKEQEAGLSQLQRTAGQDRRLLQISGSAAEFNQLRNQSDALASQFGVDRAVVREVIFSAVSENFRDAVPAIIAANQVVDPMAAAGVAGQVPALFKNQIGNLEAVDLTLKAAQASRLDFEQLAKSLPQAAEGGGIAKATAEETLAVLSVLASEFKSGETAADRIKGFATKAGISEDLSGIGIVAAVEKLQAMSPAGRAAFLKDSQELNVAYQKMAENLPLIKQRIGEFAKERADFAGGGGIIRTQTEIALNDAQFNAVREASKARQEFEKTQANVSGSAGGINSAAALKVEQQLLQNGSYSARLANSIGIGSGAARLAADSGYSTETAAGIGIGTAQGSADLGRLLLFLGTAGNSEVIPLLWKSINSLTGASENLNQAAGKITNNNARISAAGAAN